MSRQLIAAVQAADESQIVKACERLGPRFRSGLLVGLRNRYARNTIAMIRSDRNSVPPRYRRQLAEYLAAAAIVHNFDGWTYLSRAAGATLHGDLDTAVHLAYYAELRAAISILSANGIGIFSNHHVALDDSGADHWFGCGTHEAAWKALKAWAEKPESSDALLGAIGAAGYPLDQWITAANANVATSIGSVVASQWLKEWSVDLEIFVKERERRNEVSYRPQNLHNPQEVHYFKRIYRILEIGWELLEPSVDEPFSGLDQRLLYHALVLLHRKVKAISPNPAQSFSEFVSRTCSTLGLPKRSHIEHVLQRLASERVHDLFAAAALTDGYKDSVEQITAMLARGLLLLRVSSAFSRRLLSRCGLSTVDIGFWWRAFGARSGLWAPGMEPERLDDLWADVEPTLDEVTTWVNSEGLEIPLARAHESLASELLTIQQLTRAGIWGSLPTYEAA